MARRSTRGQARREKPWSRRGSGRDEGRRRTRDRDDEDDREPRRGRPPESNKMMIIGGIVAAVVVLGLLFVFIKTPTHQRKTRTTARKKNYGVLTQRDHEARWWNEGVKKGVEFSRYRGGRGADSSELDAVVRRYATELSVPTEYYNAFKGGFVEGSTPKTGGRAN